MTTKPNIGRSFRFTHALVRTPSLSVSAGLRASDGDDPDAAKFREEHAGYVAALRATGVEVSVLPPLEEFPDAVFVEDPVLCLAGKAILLRPGAQKRAGEAGAILPDLKKHFDEVLTLPGDGCVEGGDILVTDDEVFVGLSARTNQAGFDALAKIASELGYKMRRVETSSDILHFKTESSLLDSETMLATPKLAATGCFDGYKIIETPQGEEAAANGIRVNDVVLISAGFPKTKALLEKHGYAVRSVASYEAAKIDGGLSCMSLRYSK